MHQVGRFACVGFINTGIDFAVLNALVYLFSPSNLDVVFLFSIVSTLSAMCFSYFLNRIYAFKNQVNGSASLKEAGAFFLFSTLALIANASVFLFSFKYLPVLIHLPEWGALNLAKFFGVCGGASVSYLTYSFFVFPPTSLKDFKKHFSFPYTTPFWVQGTVIFGLAAFLRGGYLFYTRLITGDAVQYSVIGEQIASYNFASIDTFWMGLFSYWEALFYMMGLERVSATLIATLIPALLLTFPLLAIARALYGTSVAWIVGLFYAFHPRLISWSGNGYAESFYLFFMTVAVFYLIRYMQASSSMQALLWGLFMGVCVAVRNEALIFYLGATAVLFYMNRKGKIFVSLIGLFLVLMAYATVSEYTVGTPALFQKFQVASKHYSEQLDPELAAKETYSSFKEPSKGAFSVLIERFPRNLRYTIERLPGVLLSPLIIFAFLLPAFAKSKKEAAPLLLMALFPVLFYPLMQVEPRYLYPVLIPVQIFGAAGLYAFSRYLSWPLFQQGVVLFILLTQFFTTIWIAIRTQEKEEVHQQLAAWVQEHTNLSEEIQGDGYGWINTTAFLANRPMQPREWTENPEKLLLSLKKRGNQILILYEPFLRASNQALLPVLHQGLPGFKKVYEVQDKKGMKYQIYRLGDS